MPVHVDLEVGLVVEAFTTRHARVSSLLSVRAQMLRQRALARVRLGAKFARERALACMLTHVDQQCRPRGESLLTDVTHVRPLVRVMVAPVHEQGRWRAEGGRTLVALVRLQAAVAVHVALQRGLGAEVGVTDPAEEGAAVAGDVDPQEVRVEELVADGTRAALLVARAGVVLVTKAGRLEGAPTGVALVDDWVSPPNSGVSCRIGGGGGNQLDARETVPRGRDKGISGLILVSNLCQLTRYVSTKVSSVETRGGVVAIVRV